VRSVAITNIGSLVTNDESLELGLLGELHAAAIVVEDGNVAWVGSATMVPDTDESINVEGRTVLPGFVDSHAHLMFAGDRAAEFSARMSGEAYAAGGIRTTVSATRAASDLELEANYLRLVAEMRSSGITTFETKSGYGLTVEDEARSLRIAAKHTTETTFLGAHVVPAEFADRADDYVSLVTGEMLNQVSGSAKWIFATEEHSRLNKLARF
jgi:imidazolonepropionase